MPTMRKCPHCEFETEDAKIRFCPEHGAPLGVAVVWYDAFISYRHKGGKFAAQAIRSSLELHRGLQVFVDVNELRAGVFDEALLTKIEAAPNFILVLSEDSLERCQNEGDWLRREIVHALKHGRHIIPVLIDGFTMPPAESLPADIRELTRWQAVRFDDTFPDGSYRRIGEWCKLESKEAAARASSGPTTGTPDAPPPVGPDLGQAAPSRAGAASRAEVKAQPQLPGGLVVLTEPAGAEVQVGGAELAVSPATIRNLPPREYSLTLTLEGYEPVTTSVVVAPDKFTKLPPFKLVRQVGSLVVGSRPAPVDWNFARTPPGLQPEITQGKTPEVLDSMPTGTYAVQFRREDWPAVVQEVCVEPGRTAEVDAEFIGGSLAVSSEPSGAEIVRDGTVIGTTPQTWSDLLPGAVTFELRCAGYQPAMVSGRIEARQTLRLAARLEKITKLESGQPCVLSDLALELRPIPAGRFTMGSPPSEPGRDSDEKQHEVRISREFWLGKTEVTVAQWRAVMGTSLDDQVRKALADDTVYDFGGGNKKTLRAFWGMCRDADLGKHIGDRSDECPMVFVSWEDAMEFCRRLTAGERAAGRLPAGYVYTLPTEAQWEYACRAGTTGAVYESGYEIVGERNAPVLDGIAWYGGNSSVGYSGRGCDTAGWKEKQYPGGIASYRVVGGKRANAWGLHDMIGNVFEWCADRYGAYPDGGEIDPMGATSGSYRVNRGGGWRGTASRCRSAARNWLTPGDRYVSLGFRLALVPQVSR